MPNATITASEIAQQLSRAKPPMIIDVRSAAEFNAQNLPGSVNIPLHVVSESQLKQVLTQNDLNCPIYLLCASGMRAQKAASVLGEATPFTLVVIEGGLTALADAGAKLHIGKSGAIPLERQVRIVAGSLVIISVVLGATVAPTLFGLAAFVGAGLVFAGVTDTCGMGMMLARMPWNRAA